MSKDRNDDEKPVKTSAFLDRTKMEEGFERRWRAGPAVSGAAPFKRSDGARREWKASTAMMRSAAPEMAAAAGTAETTRRSCRRRL
ncbi:hypothetical protein BHE74_00031525 [Ensete ventricosum]|nr:hypothetical protein BHE74_00031525 [Ensete ventricosum]RZR93551.1 hypothetical protein BHM03_00022086 [Ensete ventricosum]